MEPSGPSNGYRGSSSSTTRSTFRSLCSSVTPPLPPSTGKISGRSCTKVVAPTTRAATESHRDHSRTTLKRSNAKGTPSPAATASTSAVTFDESSTNLATARPTVAESTASRTSRTDSFTRGPNLRVETSIATAASAGPSRNRRKKSATSRLESFAAENTVRFLP